MSNKISKLVNIADSVAAPDHAQTGSPSPETDFGKHTKTIVSVDSIIPGIEDNDVDLTDSDHQPEDDTGTEKPSISALATIAEIFNAALNTALYGFGPSRKKIEEQSIRIDELNASINTANNALSEEVKKGYRQEEEYRQETELLKQNIQELNDAVQARDRQLEQQRLQLESKAREIALQNACISELKDEIDTNSATTQKLSESHAHECEELNTQISSMSAEFQSFRVTYDDLATHASKLENLNRALHESSISENELHKSELNDKNNTIASLRTKVDAAGTLRTGLVEDATSTDDLHSEARDLETRLKEAEASQHRLEERAKVADTLEAEVDELRATLQNTTDSCLHTTGDTKTTIDSLKSEIEALKSLLSASEERNEQLQAAFPDASLAGNPDDSNALLIAQDSESTSEATDRVQFISHLNTFLAEQAGSDKNETAMYILVDNFIHIRDEIGVMDSEHVINKITDVITAFCNGDEIISRFGDCTFVVLSHNENTDKTREKAEKIRSAIEHTIFEASGNSVITSTSIGICKLRNSDTCAEEVVARADLACETARSSGGNKVILGSTTTDDIILKDPNGEHEAVVRSTLAENRITLYYQPISCMKKTAGVHYEVLIRIVDEGGDTILPGEFFSMAENSGQSVDIDHYVIEKIMQMMVENRDQKMMLFIKLTSQTVADHDFPLWLIGKIKEYQIDPGQLVFEIAECTLQNDIKNLSMLSNSLKTIGCKIAIEHYRMSTQQQHLLHIHTDYLKIDSGLIEGLGRKGKCFSKVVAIMDVAREHNYLTIAEGVENPASLAILWELGVDLAQGYFIQPPDRNRDYVFQNETSESGPTEGSKAVYSIA